MRTLGKAMGTSWAVGAGYSYSAPLYKSYPARVWQMHGINFWLLFFSLKSKTSAACPGGARLCCQPEKWGAQ